MDYELKQEYVGGVAVECRSGWLNIINDCYDELLSVDPDVSIGQIKEKFGTLRFYFHTDKDLWNEMHDIVAKYEGFSAITCEICSEPGDLVTRNGYWYKTLCKECFEKN